MAEQTTDRRTQLALWTHRFSAMIGAGVSLRLCLATLEQEPSTPDLRDVTRGLGERVEQGETMTQALAHWPDLFDEDYLSSVRMGEIGGILDDTLAHLADRMARGLAPVPVTPGHISRAEVAEWLWRLAKMLESGVPLLSALGTLAEIGPPILRRVSQEMREEVGVGGALAPDDEEAPLAAQPALWRYPGLFHPTTLRLFGFAVWFGPFAARVLKAAELLETEALLEIQGKLSPLPLPEPPGEVAAPPQAASDHPVVRQVNALLGDAIRGGARWVILRPGDAAAGQADLSMEGAGSPYAVVALTQYDQVTRRLKVMAGLDPFVRDDRQAYLTSEIHVRHEGQDYRVHLRSAGRLHADEIHLSLSKGDGALQV
jgi:hypothetical protein